MINDTLEKSKRGRVGILFLLGLVIAAGIALRFAFPDDIEYKSDERYTFHHAMALLAGAPWEWVGMPTSFGVLNPGLSVWFFSALAWISGASTPPQLARGVQALNGAALVAMVLFILRAIPPQRREVWLWGTAMWAANPIAIIYERKIWPPSPLPLFTVGFLAAWWYRHHAVAAAIWGMLGALMAQMQLGGAVLAFAFAGWSAFFARRSTHWAGWFVGSAIGALPALPWFVELLNGTSSRMRLNFPLPQFFLRWVTQPFGLGLHTFGYQDWMQFLRFPLVGGVPTFLMTLIHAALLALWLWVLVQVIAAVRREGWVQARAPRVTAKEDWLPVNAALWGYGGALTAMTLIGVAAARNYLIPVAPLMGLWAALLVFEWTSSPDLRKPRFLLASFCLLQLALSAGLLLYIHRTQTVGGQYGPTWCVQQTDCRPSQ